MTRSSDDLEPSTGTETLIGYPITSFAANAPTEMQEAPVPIREIVVPLATFRRVEQPAARTTDQVWSVERPRRRRVLAVIAAIVAMIGCAAVAWYLWNEDSPAPPRAPVARARTAAASSAAPTPRPATVQPAQPARASSPPPAPPAPELAKPSPSDRGSCSLRVEADETRSVVMLDGKVFGESPITLSGLFCGRPARVTVARPHFATWERTIIPEEGRPAVVRAALARPTTAIAVTSVPAGAMVRVNGRDVTTTPAAIAVTVDVALRIEVALPGYNTFTQTVVARSGATSTIDATLTASH
jgi:hypothetical protein